MARFDGLTEYLAKYGADSVILTFDEIESLSGARLPRSARKIGSPFWDNGPRNVYAKHWLAAGFEAGFDECEDNEVQFARRAPEPELDPAVATELGDERLPPPPPPPPPPQPDPISLLPPPPPPISALPPPPTEVTRAASAARLSRDLSETFTLAQPDLLVRKEALRPGWDHLPDVGLAARLRAVGTDDVWVRLLLTFGALLDRGRHRPDVWLGIGALFDREPAAFDPGAIAGRAFGELAEVLRGAGLTDRLTDVAAWRLVAEILGQATSPSLNAIIYSGRGDARALRAELVDAAPIPQLATPESFTRWVRTLAYPGGATLGSLGDLDIVVDADVRRASELLGVASTSKLPVARARPIIQAVWAEAGRTNPPAGPPGLTGTPLALDQALWYHGRVGCRWCRSHTRIEPIGPACESCVLKAAADQA
jgi:hypothetical protein